MGYFKGFMTGVGVMLIVISIGLFIAAATISEQIKKYEGDITMLYSLTHGPTYDVIYSLLGQIGSLAKALSAIPGAPQILEKMGISIEELYSSSLDMQEKLHKLRAISETLYSEIRHQKISSEMAAIASIITIIGLTVTAAGIGLEVHERRKLKSMT